jgi:hypothetical protein
MPYFSISELTQIIQLTTEDTKEYIDNKRKKDSFSLCTLLFTNVRLTIFTTILRGHGEIFKNTMFLKSKVISVPSVVFLKCIFRAN